MAQEIYGGTVRVRSGTVESVAADGSVVWTWRPPAARVISVLAVPGGVDTVVRNRCTDPISRGARVVGTTGACGSDTRLSCGSG